MLSFWDEDASEPPFLLQDGIRSGMIMHNAARLFFIRNHLIRLPSMLLVSVLRAEEVALVIAFPAMSLPELLLLFLPVTAFAAAVPMLLVTLVIAAPAAAARTVWPRLFFALPFFAGSLAAFLSSFFSSFCSSGSLAASA